MNTAKKTLRQVAMEACDIYSAWSDAADRDAGFDGGEFSGPACATHADEEVKQLAEANGFTLDEVMHETNVVCNEIDACVDCGEEYPAVELNKDGVCRICMAEANYEPEGMVDYENEDRRAYFEERNENGGY